MKRPKEREREREGKGKRTRGQEKERENTTVRFARHTDERNVGCVYHRKVFFN